MLTFYDNYKKAAPPSSISCWPFCGCAIAYKRASYMMRNSNNQY